MRTFGCSAQAWLGLTEVFGAITHVQLLIFGNVLACVVSQDLSAAVHDLNWFTIVLGTVMIHESCNISINGRVNVTVSVVFPGVGDVARKVNGIKGAKSTSILTKDCPLFNIFLCENAFTHLTRIPDLEIRILATNQEIFIDGNALLTIAIICKLVTYLASELPKICTKDGLDGIGPLWRPGVVIPEPPGIASALFSTPWNSVSVIGVKQVAK